MRLETLPITARSFEKDYHIDGDEFGRAYKDHISGFRTCEELDHADEWLTLRVTHILLIKERRTPWLTFSIMSCGVLRITVIW